MGRRKAGQLIALEVDILVEAIRLASTGQSEFHGFGIARELRDGNQSKGLIAHGTLYKALGRLENLGLVESSLEDPAIAADARRPRRRLYRITSTGRVAAANALSTQTEVRHVGWQSGTEPV